jgi:hypothetical protein
MRVYALVPIWLGCILELVCSTPLQPDPYWNQKHLVAFGVNHTCVVALGAHYYVDDREGVRCWGDNSKKQLGEGVLIPRGSYEKYPQAVYLGPNLWSEPEDYNYMHPVAIAAGSYHTCAIMKAGVVKCWGDNSFGQLGNPDFTASAVYTIPLPDTAEVISAGIRTTCAILKDSSTWCWGMSGSDGVSSSEPQKIEFNDLAAVELYGSTDALLTDGSVVQFATHYTSYTLKIDQTQAYQPKPPMHNNYTSYSQFPLCWTTGSSKIVQCQTSGTNSIMYQIPGATTNSFGNLSTLMEHLQLESFPVESGDDLCMRTPNSTNELGQVKFDMTCWGPPDQNDRKRFLKQSDYGLGGSVGSIYGRTALHIIGTVGTDLRSKASFRPTMCVRSLTGLFGCWNPNLDKIQPLNDVTRFTGGCETLKMEMVLDCDSIESPLNGQDVFRLRSDASNLGASAVVVESGPLLAQLLSVGFYFDSPVFRIEFASTSQRDNMDLFEVSLHGGNRISSMPENNGYFSIRWSNGNDVGKWIELSGRQNSISALKKQHGGYPEWEFAYVAQKWNANKPVATVGKSRVVPIFAGATLPNSKVMTIEEGTATNIITGAGDILIPTASVSVGTTIVLSVTPFINQTIVPSSDLELVGPAMDLLLTNVPLEGTYHWRALNQRSTIKQDTIQVELPVNLPGAPVRRLLSDATPAIYRYEPSTELWLLYSSSQYNAVTKMVTVVVNTTDFSTDANGKRVELSVFRRVAQATTTPIPESSNVGLIIGVTLGGSVVLAMLVWFAWFYTPSNTQSKPSERIGISRYMKV